MDRAVEVGGDVAATGGALAGLLLVYLGAVTASFASFDAAAQKAVRHSHQRKAWFGFSGMALSLLAVAGGLLGKWLGMSCLAVSSIIILLIALLWVVAAALQTVLEIQ